MTAVDHAQRAYRPSQAAELLGVSRRHVYALIERGELRTVKSGTATLIRAEWIDDYLDALEAS